MKLNQSDTKHEPEKDTFSSRTGHYDIERLRPDFQEIYRCQTRYLVEMLTEEEANEITHLVLQGKLNAVDFRHLRDEFKKLQILDISNASISMYAGKNGTHPDRFYIYPANCIPSYAFCKQLGDSTFAGKTSLTEVILSDKTKNIEDGAFKGCTNLKICRIRKKTPPTCCPKPWQTM